MQALDATQQLLEAEKMAAIGRLAAGMAHEINNPLAFVKSNLACMEGYTEELLRTAAEERLQRQRCGATSDGDSALDLDFFRQDIAALFAETRSGIARIANIVQRLRVFSQIDGECEWGLANLNSGLERALHLVAHEVGASVEILSELRELPPIECSASLIDQVFVNLLSNAIHAVGNKGRIWLSSGSISNEVWVEVADDGCGVAPEHLEQLFEPFFTTRAIGQGMGLGLSVAYGIVRRHGGRLQVASRAGGGSLFRVVLPVMPAVLAGQQQAVDNTAEGRPRR